MAVVQNENVSSSSGTEMKGWLLNELKDLEHLHGQNPDSGVGSSKSHMSAYTNRIFGAPYQLLDSVDARFDDINKHLGNEYLRNFIFNSPILYIRPGIPRYTGNDDTSKLSEQAQIVYETSFTTDDGTTVNGMDMWQNIALGLASSLVFGSGSKLQKRMFEFKERYSEYNKYVSYMCKSMANFLELTSSTTYPTGTFTGEGNWEEFSTIRWENYRLLSDSYVKTDTEYLRELFSTTALGQMVEMPGDIYTAISNQSSGSGESKIIATDESTGETYMTIQTENGWTEGAKEYLTGQVDGTFDWGAAFSSALEAVTSDVQYAIENSFASARSKKVTSVQFMVEPVHFEEQLRNQTKQSLLEDVTDGIGDTVGSEIAWMTNSNTDTGVIDDIFNFLGGMVEGINQVTTKVASPFTGSFIGNIFSGALGSLKGQKMIYPKIYQKSESSMNYNFSMTLTSPYGDTYNYFMNIVVPLMHLIALAAPRMVTSNSISSPFLVQAYIPGMCTCNLGIISEMQIEKNPTTKHVSVDGFPLTVKVSFTVEELYNALAISPANNPISFLFNETLNDYLCNMAGLIPSANTMAVQRQNALDSVTAYFQDNNGAGLLNDFSGNLIDAYSNFIKYDM